MAKERLFLGLYSGPSADGVDAVLASITGKGLRMKAKAQHHLYRALPDDVRKRIRKLTGGGREDAADIAELDRDVALAFADAAHALLRHTKHSSEPFLAIGSSGQTIALVPSDKDKPIGGVIELGLPPLIAQKTHLPVISHFIQSDLAAGGVGSPLTAWPDWLLFRDKKLSRVIVHLGGITEMAFIGSDAHPEDVVAMDVGPGTAVLDTLAEKDFGLPFDSDGALAARGTINSQLLNELLAHPYFRRKAPKSCPPVEWGDAYIWRLTHMASKRRCEGANLLATFCELIAKTISNAVATMTERPHQVVLSGGGARNILLAARIRALLSPSSTIAASKFDLNVRAKQALCYAILAAARIDGFAAHTPRATGAKNAVVLGTMALP